MQGSFGTGGTSWCWMYLFLIRRHRLPRRRIYGPPHRLQPSMDTMTKPETLRFKDDARWKAPTNQTHHHWSERTIGCRRVFGTTSTGTAVGGDRDPPGAGSRVWGTAREAEAEFVLRARRRRRRSKEVGGAVGRWAHGREESADGTLFRNAPLLTPRLSYMSSGCWVKLNEWASGSCIARCFRLLHRFKWSHKTLA